MNSVSSFFGLTSVVVIVIFCTPPGFHAQLEVVGVVTFEATAKLGYYLTASTNNQFVLTSATPSSLKSNQIFHQLKMSMTSTALYNIITGMSSSCSNMCLDVRLSNGPPGPAKYLAVTQVSCAPGNMSQYWTLTPSPTEPTDSVYKWLKNFSTGHCATAEAETPGNTVNSYVDDYACTAGAAHQLWQVSTPPDASAGGSTVTNKAYGTCLQVKGGSSWSGTVTNDGTCATGAFFQHFSLNSAPSAYGYRNTGTNACIDGGGGPGTPYQYGCTFTALNHQWLAAQFPDTAFAPYIYLVDMLGGYCLTNDPSQINWMFMSPCDKTNPNQRWNMRGLAP